MKKYIITVVLVIFAILIVWISLLRYQVRKLREIEPSVIIQTDTIRDTIKTISPVPVLIEVGEPFIVPAKEFVLITGSDSVIVPKQVKTYQDSTYRVVISGYKPNLDSINIYQKVIERTITKTVTNKAPRVTFGVTAGWGVVYIDNQFKLAPGIIAGVQFKF